MHRDTQQNSLRIIASHKPICNNIHVLPLLIGACRPFKKILKLYASVILSSFTFSAVDRRRHLLVKWLSLEQRWTRILRSNYYENFLWHTQCMSQKSWSWEWTASLSWYSSLLNFFVLDLFPRFLVRTIRTRSTRLSFLDVFIRTRDFFFLRHFKAASAQQ